MTPLLGHSTKLKYINAVFFCPGLRMQDTTSTTPTLTNTALRESLDERWARTSPPGWDGFEGQKRYCEM